MKTVVILQSNYIPWKGYFDLINDADEFVFYDDVQFTKSDWRSRNKIKTPKGSEWLSIPVGNRQDRLVCEVEIEDDSWQRKHFNHFKLNYSKCSFYSRYESLLEEMYLETSWRYLSDFNQFTIKRISNELGAETIFTDSRDYKAKGRKQEKVISLLNKSQARTYISGPAAKNYIEEHKFAESGISLVWKDYTNYPEYEQRFPPFDHYVSVLDLMLNVGGEAPWYIWGWRNSDQNKDKIS